MITLHLHERCRPQSLPPKSNNTLCRHPIGSTHGIVRLLNFIDPVRGADKTRVYEVFLTRLGLDAALGIDPNLRAFKDRGYWSVWIPGRAFFEESCGYFKLCKDCRESDEYALMVLADL